MRDVLARCGGCDGEGVGVGVGVIVEEGESCSGCVTAEGELTGAW
jgi:hypothetical protein